MKTHYQVSPACLTFLATTSYFSTSQRPTPFFFSPLHTSYQPLPLHSMGLSIQVKTSLLLALVPTVLVGLSHGQVTHDEMADAISEAFKTYDNQLGEIKSYFKSLARQVMLQQFNFEQRSVTVRWALFYFIRKKNRKKVDKYKKKSYLVSNSGSSFPKAEGYSE